MRSCFRVRRQVVLVSLSLLTVGAALAGIRSSAPRAHAGQAAAMVSGATMFQAPSGGLASTVHVTSAPVASTASSGTSPSTSQFGAVRSLGDVAARTNAAFDGTLHFDGNTDESGCTGDGGADIAACGGPFLKPTATLSTAAAAHFDVSDPILKGTNLRSIYEPNWIWNSGPTTLVGTMTVNWWASCGGCVAGTFDAEWDIRLYVDPPPTGYPAPNLAAHVVASPSAPNTAELLTATIPIPSPGITVASNVVLQIDPFFDDVQANTHIYYDTSLSCPTSTSLGACDSTVTFNSTSPPPPPPPPVPTYTTGNIGFGPATVMDFQRTEGEPQLIIDKNGNYWETGPWGFSTTQSFIHRSTDGGDQFNVVSPVGLRPNSPPGGGDSTITTDDQGYAYFGDLEGALEELDCSVSNDNGNTWVKNPACVPFTGTDRQWLAVDNGSNHTPGAAGAADNTVFYAYHDVAVGHVIFSSPGSTGTGDLMGGLVFQNANAGLGAFYGGGGNCGKLIFDPVSRNLYYPCGASNHVDITIGHVNPGQRTGIIFHTVSLATSPGGTVSNLFPLAAVDSTGKVYLVWSDTGDHNIYYSASTNLGENWTTPVLVNSGPANTNVFSWAEAGTTGHLAVVWLGNASNLLSDNMPNWATSPSGATGYPWFGYVALITGANTATPTIEQDRFTEKPMNYGQICNGGIGCTISMGDRTMADFLSVAIAADGSIQIAYNDTTSQYHGAHLFEERQLTGPTAIGTTLAKPTPVNPAFDPAGDAQWPHYAPTGPGSNQADLDLRSVALNQQDANTLRVRMTVNTIAGFAAPTGKADAFWITRFQALSRDDGNTTEAYRIFYVGAESVGGQAPTFFAGSPLLSPTLPATTGCNTTTPGNCKVLQYPAEIAGVTGQIVGNTICVDLPLNAFGAARPIASNATLYNVTAFTGGRDDATADIYADVDSTHSFDYPLGTVAQTDCGAPTAVRMLGFGARPTRGGVDLRWRTASEGEVLGFNVWRRGAGGESRVNRSLVTARGTVAGASYRLVDRAARPGRSYAYRLQIVSRDGSRSWYGSARVRVTG